jgi:hypothetical protein
MVILTEKIQRLPKCGQYDKGFLYMKLALRISDVPEVQSTLFLSLNESVSIANGIFYIPYNKPIIYSTKIIHS